MASQYISQFARLMRQVLETSREKFIGLDQEIEMLENYLALHKIQAEHELNYHIKVDEAIDIDFISIPPMFVQPFVENALAHGIINQKGTIAIHFELLGDKLGVKIIDDGVGFDHQNPQNHGHKSLATSIIKERIENYNQQLKTDINFSITDASGTENGKPGTMVTLWLPFSEG